MRLLFLLLIFLCQFPCEFLYAQKAGYSEYYLIRRNYEGFAENDERAMPCIGKYIAKAKKNKDYDKLYQGYADGVEFSADRDIKLRYADSTITAAKLSGNQELISSAYLEKGVVYYFHFKKYKLALDEFLVALQYAKNSKDPYYQNRLSYLIGVVKSYMGYYDEALLLFKKTRSHFASELTQEHHPNILYDNRRGYFNSLHQMAICYRHMEKYKLADSIISVGFTDVGANREHRQESGYFLKEKGISEYRKKEFSASIISFQASIIALSKINDFSWLAVDYAYLGKSYLALEDRTNAVKNSAKVDSIFQRYHFVVPEVRDTYVFLIDHYKTNHDIKRQLHYTNQLLKVDSTLLKDFSYLPRKMNSEFDTRLLKENEKRLEKKSTADNFAKWGLGSIAIAFAVSLLIYKRREKQISRKYHFLKQRIAQESIGKSFVSSSEKKDGNKFEIDQKIVDDLLQKLQNFEKKEAFKEHGLTLHKLADKFDTNHSYLSQVVNEYKGMNFTKYLADLRIRYITDKLYNEELYIKYTIETLAEECGMASRNHFSKLFHDINGIRPGDFIKKRQDDMNNKQAQSD